MLKHIQVREYARLTTDTSASPTPDLAVIKPDTFNWLVSLSEQPNSGRFISFEKPDCLRLHSYVGYLQSPAGEGIEVLLKISNSEYDPQNGRAVLCKMLCSALHLPYKEAHAAQLTRMNLPIHEWIYHQFLAQLNGLVASGLRFDYLRIEEESRFIRGQLNVTAQQRQPAERAHLFHIRHDIYHPNRLENRLMKSALDYIQDNCRSPENWRLANELSHILDPVQSLTNPLNLMPRWSNSKTLDNYRDIKPWCEIILEKMNPHFQKGLHRGISLLFPMERLFEEHVAACLKKMVTSPWQLKTQASSKHMIEARDKLSDTDKNRFYLKPDLLIDHRGEHRYVMDTKWKLINSSNSQKNFDLSQSDIYQMFAYGHKYLSGNGDLVLIYPKHDKFTLPMPYFKLASDLRLWVIPFCVESNKLISGEWMNHFLTLTLS
ncbi:McrC family protein [Psychrobacter sp. NPDC078409]|uniref:McrC family protein n=1 Tax=Psychrobacter sp. NPDC078409 TaxID=3390660 RepID=UPI003D017609